MPKLAYDRPSPARNPPYKVADILPADTRQYDYRAREDYTAQASPLVHLGCMELAIPLLAMPQWRRYNGCSGKPFVY